MVTSETQVCNSALDILGIEPIISLNDDNKQGRLCFRNYPIVRDDILHDHYWNFAMKRVELAKLATNPLFEYSSAFQLPPDYLRVRRLNNEETDYRVEGDTLISDGAEAKIEYIFRQTDVTKYSPAFVEALAYRLAAKLAYPLVQSVNLGEKLSLKAESILKQARSKDGQEGHNQDLLQEDVWLNSRRAGPRVRDVEV